MAAPPSDQPSRAEDRRGGPPWVQVGRLLLGVLAITALLISLQTGLFRGMHHWQIWERIFRCGCALFAIIVTCFLFRSRRDRLKEEKPQVNDFALPDPERLRNLKDRAANTYHKKDRQSIVSFIDLVTNPAKHRIRVAETVELDGRAVIQHVAVEFSLPADAEQAEYLFVPLLQPLKGELVDNFHLRDSRDDSLADLSYEETTQLAAAGLRLLIHTGLLKAESASSSDDSSVDEIEGAAAPTDVPTPADLDEEVREGEQWLLSLIASRGFAGIETVRSIVVSALDLLKSLDQDVIARIEKYVLALCGSYPIVAVVSPASVTSQRLLLKYERTLTPASQRKDLRGLLRLGFGMRPSQISLPVDLALTAGSYHLRVNAPESKYVFEQLLVCKFCNGLLTPGWKPAPAGGGPKRECRHSIRAAEPERSTFYGKSQYFRLQRRRGQSFVHVYMRGFGVSDTKIEGLALVVRFKEVPPGSRANASVTATATTTLVFAIGYLVSHARLSPLSDLPALVLGLPAVAASWFGISSERDSLIGASLSARFSLIFSGLVSIASVVAYLVDGPNEPGGKAPTDVSSVGILGVNHPVWVILLAVSLINTLFIYYRFGLKLVHYHDLLARTQEPWSKVLVDFE